MKVDFLVGFKLGIFSPFIEIRGRLYLRISCVKVGQAEELGFLSEPEAPALLKDTNGNVCNIFYLRQMDGKQNNGNFQRNTSALTPP